MAQPSGWTTASDLYVRPGPSAASDAWAAEAAQKGGTGTQRLIDVAEVVPPRQVAEALGTGSDPVVVRRRVMLLDDHPVELTDSYYPLAVARGTDLAEARKIPGGAVRLLAGLGFQPHQVIEDVHARRATAGEASALELQPEDWVLVLLRRIAGEDGSPFEASVMITPAEGHHLQYALSIG